MRIIIDIDPFSTDFAPGGATASASTTGSESPDRDGAGADVLNDGNGNE